MKFYLISAILAISVAASHQANYSASNGISSKIVPLPDEVNQLHDEIVRLHSCVLQRLFAETSHLYCDSSESKTSLSLLGCVCDNKEMLYKAILDNTDICIDKENKFGEFARDTLASRLMPLVTTLCITNVLDVRDFGLLSACAAANGGH